jgi:hypothetical protein
MILGDR